MGHCKTGKPGWTPDHEFDVLVEGFDGQPIQMGRMERWGMNRDTYTQQIERQLVSWSVADDYETAVREWRYSGRCHAQGGQCELCGNTNLVYLFEIESSTGQQPHWLGSECIENYRIAGAAGVSADRSRMEKQRRLEQDLALLTQAAERNSWVRRNLTDLERKLRKYGSLTPKVRAICKI